MLCMDLTQLVIGTRFSLFRFEFFLKGVYLSFPLVSIMALLMIILYQIRHPQHSVPSVAVFIALNLLLWAMLMPLVLGLSLRTDIRPPAAAPSASSGFFRNEDGLVYYWEVFSHNGKGEGLYIDLYGVHGEPGQVYPLHQVDKPEQKTPSPFADTLVQKSIDMPKCVSIPLTAYLSLLYYARDCLSRGYLQWLGFASLGLAFMSLYGLGWLSSWRLLNAFVVMVVSVCIALVNYALYAGLLLPGVSRFWQLGLGAFGKHVPFTACVNVLIALCMLGIGLANSFLRREKARGAD